LRLCICSTPNGSTAVLFAGDLPIARESAPADMPREALLRLAGRCWVEAHTGPLQPGVAPAVLDAIQHMDPKDLDLDEVEIPVVL